MTKRNDIILPGIDSLRRSDDEVSGTLHMGTWGGGHWRKKMHVMLDAMMDEPTDIEIAKLAAVLERRETLDTVLVHGLWKELTGETPSDWAWWAGDLEAVHRHLNEFREGPPVQLEKAEDLYRFLDPYTIYVTEDLDAEDRRTAVVSCYCDFEEEHGIDLLTDGVQVLGTGYSTEATRFPQFREKPKST